LCHALGITKAANIRSNRECGAAALCDFVGRGLSEGTVNVGDDDFGTFARETLTVSFADTLSAACNDDYPSV
jgi:hypothetical protein